MTPRQNSDDDERERPSWREIDRMRDRSRHVSRGEQRPAKERSLRTAWAKQEHLKEAEKVFQGVRGTKEYKAAIDTIHRSYGSAKFSGAVKKFLATYGVPAEWGTLLLLLDYKDEAILAEVIEKLKGLAAKRSAVEKQGLKNKLEILTFTAKSSRITSVAEAALTEL
ncbi:MAG TPA: hypothetical protein VMU60_01010 [Syntrophobacteria bacterium]|nr:hypothetical protein [Syntrophobacteria bacterium]